MDTSSKTFTYTYSASQQEELKRIRKKYAPISPEENKMEQLHRLDKSATKPGVVVSLLVGIISSLILGSGMCCTMLWSDTLFFPGIVIGLVGIAGICAAYPLYVLITEKRRNKIAPEIMRLTDELMK